MTSENAPSATSARTLPAQPNLENLKNEAKQRLKALRSTWAAPLPGQALVVLDQQRMLITDVFLSEDGHAQERRLIAQGLQHVKEDQL